MIKMTTEAHALRPVRFLPGDRLRVFTAVTFPNDPPGGCSVYARRCEVFGGVAEGEGDSVGVCDILDSDGSIIGDFWINSKGLRYLYRALNLRVEDEGR